MMKEYQSYLFDLDGTLISTVGLILECFHFSLKKFLGVEANSEDIQRKIGLPLKEQFTLFIKEYNKNPADYDLNEMAKVHMDYQLEIWQDYVFAYDHAIPLLELLKKENKKTAIVTSRLMRTTSLYLDHVGLKDYFDSIITPEATIKHKPNPEPVFEALKQIGHKEGEVNSAVMIGDASFDILAAQSAGVDSIWVRHESNLSISPQPTYIAENLLEIKNLFQNSFHR